MISPRTAVWLNVAYTLVTGVVTGSITFGGLVTPTEATQIVALAATIQGILNALLHGVSSPEAGPLVSRR